VKTFKTGKLDLGYMEQLLAKIPFKDNRIVVGPRVGEDAAVIDFGDRYLVAKTDPITFTPEKLGWYAVNVNANDVACMGAHPKWFLACLLLPEKKTDKKLVDAIFEDLLQACNELHISLCGGHTEITYGIDRPIIAGMMLGEVKKEKLIVNRKASVGDVIILTKGVAIEGTSIIARDKEKELKKHFSSTFLNRAKDFIYHPGISVVKEALLANEVSTVRAMHDPTEGGLLTGAFELAKACDKGLIIIEENIFIFPETQELCKHFKLNPLGLIASGSLLIVVSEDESEKVLDVYKKEQIEAAVIGHITNKHHGIKIKRSSGIEAITPLSSDEITRLL
jgi:hydrogenase expression/formation protein HypE